MEYTVHRWRFSNWKPSAIKAFAVDDLSNLVAIGREDGNIDIHSPLEKWMSIAHISGRADFNLRSLQWSKVNSEHGRLFGVSLNGFLFEVDLRELRIKNVCDSYGGTVWCLEANPGRHADLAIGCDDGTLRVFNYSSNKLVYHKAFPSAGTRILSVSYHPKKPQLFYGCADGIIRCIEERSGKNLFRMTGDLIRGMPTIIWSLKVLSDGTVASGDNRGRLQIWDGVNGVMMSSFAQHTADVLAIVASKDEDSIFAAGVDSKVICVKRLRPPSSSSSSSSRNKSPLPSSSSISKKVSVPAPGKSTWIYTCATRPHSHDVYALGICTASSAAVKTRRDDDDKRDRTSSSGKRGRSGSVDSSSKISSSGNSSVNDNRFECLLSGGMDSKLCTYPVNEYDRSRPTWHLPVPTRGVVASSANGRIAGVQHDHHIDLWSLGQSGKSCSLALRVQLNESTFIHCSALSNDASLLCCASEESVRLWGAEYNNNTTNIPELTSIRMQHLLPKDSYVQAISFGGPGMAVATSDGSILVLDIRANDDYHNDGIGSPTSAASSEVSNEDSHGNSDRESDSNSDGDSDSEAEVEEPYIVSVRHQFDHRELIGDSRMQDTISASSIVNDKDNSSSSGSSSGSSSSKSKKTVKVFSALRAAVRSLAFSSDGSYLAVASAAYSFFVYDLDRLRLHWQPSDLPAAISCLSFHPSSSNILVVLLANNMFLSFDMDTRDLTEWSRNNTQYIPLAVLNLPRPLEALTFDPSNPSTFFAYGQNSSVYIDLTAKIPVKPKVIGYCDPISNETGIDSGTDEDDGDNSNNKLLLSPGFSDKGKAASERNKVDSRKRGNKKQKRSSIDGNSSNNRNDEDDYDQSSRTSGNGSSSNNSSDRNGNFSIVSSYRCMVHMQCLEDSEMVSQSYVYLC